jgi:2'-5' RNA ligase
MVQYFLGIVPPSAFLERLQRFDQQWSTSTLRALVDPHITVKAQGGLTPDLAWLKTVEAVCAGTKPFEVQLGAPDMFGDRVLFLSVASPGTYALHRWLVKAVQPSAADIERYMEAEDIWHAHLTLGIQGFGLTAEELLQMKETAAQELAPFPSFTVEFIRVYRLSEAPCARYEKLIDLPLGALLS